MAPFLTGPNNGLPDVIWSNDGDLGGPGNWLGNGDGSFRDGGRVDVPYGVFDIYAGKKATALADLNGDGKMDVVESDHGIIGVFLGDGAGSLKAIVSYPSPTPFFDDSPMLLADFDGDGKLDIANTSYVLQGDGNGTFRSHVAFGQRAPLIVQDINGDGKPDLVGIAPTGDAISVLINSSGSPVASAPAYLAPTGSPVLARGAIASIYGSGLTSDQSIGMLPLPSIFGNTSVELVDAAQRHIQAPLLYVSPSQINFQVPDGAATGYAMINVLGSGRPKGAHATLIQQLAPGFFTLDGSGHGAPAASAVDVGPDGKQTPFPTSSCTSDGHCAGLAIPVSSAVSQVYLSLYGTGFRHANVATCSVGDASVTPSYFGPLSESSIEDQVNILIPPTTPKGRVDITCRFQYSADPANPEDALSNAVTVVFQ